MVCSALICAQSVVIDKATNRASLLNITENINSTLFPIQYPMCIFMMYERQENEDGNYELLLNVNIDGQEILKTPFKINFIDGNLRNNSTINISGLIIPKTGKLTFAIYFKGEELRSTYINVKEKI